MASLIISRNDQLLDRIFPVHIYSDNGKLGKVQAGKTEEFELEKNIGAIHAKNCFVKSPKVNINKSENDSCTFNVYTHPAIGLIRISLLVSLLFFAALLVLYATTINWLMLLMFGFPIVLLLIAGIVFCRSHYFVIKEVNQD